MFGIRQSERTIKTLAVKVLKKNKNLILQFIFFQMCSAVHMTQGKSLCFLFVKYDMKRNSSKEYNFLFLMLSKDRSCSKNQQNSCCLIKKFTEFQRRFIYHLKTLWIRQNLVIRVCLHIGGRKWDHRTNIRGGEKNTIMGSLKLDKRNHGRSAIVFINCVLCSL